VLVDFEEVVFGCEEDGSLLVLVPVLVFALVCAQRMRAEGRAARGCRVRTVRSPRGTACIPSWSRKGKFTRVSLWDMAARYYCSNV